MEGSGGGGGGSPWKEMVASVPSTLDFNDLNLERTLRSAASVLGKAETMCYKEQYDTAGEHLTAALSDEACPLRVLPRLLHEAVARFDEAYAILAAAKAEGWGALRHVGRYHLVNLRGWAEDAALRAEEARDALVLAGMCPWISHPIRWWASVGVGLVVDAVRPIGGARNTLSSLNHEFIVPVNVVTANLLEKLQQD